MTERALTLASELGLDHPARALGYRGLARAALGDPGGLQDYREAIELASQAGQGRDVALLKNNLGVDLLSFEGPAASLAVFREGIAFAGARGLTEMRESMIAGSADVLIDTGEHEEALQIAAGVVPRLEASGDVLDLVEIRAAQARICALRGQASEIAEMLEWLESSARETEDPQLVVVGLGSVALVRAKLEQNEAVAALLNEVETYPGARDNPYYPALLPAMMRTGLKVGEPALAERLVADYEPPYPYAEHALAAANAALTEARGDLPSAAVAYSDAADRWERFGVVPELAFALLGQGRCLVGLSRPAEAAPVLQHAREIFERLQAAPALAETDALLQLTTALSS
jgi:tetratricopeptide (TPR) repeat protein